MAWYRAGGGGIPSSLKTGMNNVLNKKFGTSTTYDPAGWPDNVNLMGPLPEKTVSGAIAQFSDGADDVPIKSLVCNVDANLSGVSSVDVVHEGKNIMPPIDGEEWEDGAINASGNNATGTNARRTKGYIPVKDNSDFHLVLSGYTNTGASDRFRIFKYDKDFNFIAYAGLGAASYNLVGVAYIRMRYYSDAITWNNAQLEYRPTSDTTPTTYEPYTAPTTHTAQLGRTIYGGEVDVVAGTGTDEWGILNLENVNWSWSNTNNWWYSGVISSLVKVPSNNSVAAKIIGENVDCVSYNTLYNGTSGNNKCAINAGTQAGRLYVYTDGTQQTAPTGKIIYLKATPETFTFTPVPINSFLGDNNLWADTGDVSCTYRADIALALGGGS